MTHGGYLHMPAPVQQTVFRRQEMLRAELRIDGWVSTRPLPDDASRRAAFSHRWRCCVPGQFRCSVRLWRGSRRQGFAELHDPRDCCAVRGWLPRRASAPLASRTVRGAEDDALRVLPAWQQMRGRVARSAQVRLRRRLLQAELRNVQRRLRCGLLQGRPHQLQRQRRLRRRPGRLGHLRTAG